MASLQLLGLEQPWNAPARVLHLLSIAKQIDVLLEALKKYATESSWSQIPAVLAGEKNLRSGLCRVRCYLVSTLVTYSRLCNDRKATV